MSVTQRIIGYLGKATADGREVLGVDEPQVVVDTAHQHIHNEVAYLATYSMLRDNTDAFEIRIEVPSSAKERPNMIISYDSALAATLELWYPTTKTDASGNRIANINRVLGSSQASPLLICHTPGGSQSGDASITRYVGSPTSPAHADVGGGGNTRGELIIPQGSDILIVFTSRSDNNAMTLLFDWYE